MLRETAFQILLIFKEKEANVPGRPLVTESRISGERFVHFPQFLTSHPSSIYAERLPSLMTLLSLRFQPSLLCIQWTLFILLHHSEILSH